MMNLGISLYPDQTEFIQDQAYIDLAVSLGFTQVFMSFLQINIHNPSHSIQRIKESAKYASECGCDVCLDIHPMVFQYIDGSEEDLHYFHELGVSTLRLDAGYDGKTEAMMTHNPYGIQIELNVSRDTHELERILDYHPNKKKLRGSHNFYPQRYTGLSLSTFETCTKRFLDQGIQVAAFITSQKASVSPWPISEGLCTLEDHRDLSLEVQFRHLQMMGLIDTVIIGNTYASEEELRALAKWNQSTIPTLSIQMEQCSELERRIALDHIQEYRGDASQYVIRSTKHRMRVHKERLYAKKQSVDLQYGDVVILNEEYGQYKGELQIILQPRQCDPRINVIGHIPEDEHLLIKELQSFQSFRFQESEEVM